MTVGNETASTLGIPMARFRLTVFVVGALITGVMVAFSEIIGFVGLMTPHIVRMIVGGDYTRVLPVSALLGAIFIIWSDIAARTILPRRYACRYYYGPDRRWFFPLDIGEEKIITRNI